MGVSPIHKVAIPLGWVDDVAKAAGRAIKSSGGELLNALKKWWTAGSKNPAKIVEEVGEGLNISKLVRTKLTRELEEKANRAREGLSKVIAERNSHLKELERFLERTDRNIAKYEGIEEKSKSIFDRIKLFSKSKADTERKIMETQQQLQKLKNVFILAEKNPDDAIKLASADPDLFTLVGDWRNQVAQILRDARAVNQSQSKNLSNSGKFLEEYLSKKRIPGGEEQLQFWLSNPNNFRKLEELMSLNTVVKLIKDDAVSVPLRNKLLGFSIGDMAKRLGIGASALTGGGYAAVKLFNWFNDESKSTVSKSNGLLSALNAVQTSGYGSNILNSAKGAASKIQQLADHLDDNVDKDPETTAKTYLSGVVQEITNLNSALKEWDQVVKNSKDRETAELARAKIKEFVDNSQNNIRKLGKDLGISVNLQTPSRKPQSSEIIKIQQLLNSRGYDIPITGEVDNTTISALEALEREFPAERVGKDISGSFVNRQNKSVISYNNLIKALKILEK